MIISRTPFRISFFGGGTDYPEWYVKHGGAVLATTIDKYCYINCRYLPPFFEHRYCIVYSKVEHCQTVDEIVHPAVREALRYLEIQRGVEIHQFGLHGRSAERPLRAQGPDGQQASPRDGQRAPGARHPEGDGRIAGSGVGGLRRLESHCVPRERRDHRDADHRSRRPHQGAGLPSHALLHRNQTDRVDHRGKLRERHRRPAASAPHHEGPGGRKHLDREWRARHLGIRRASP